jgi:hypothetical protein
MKIVTAREFYHNTGLVDGLPEGHQMVVTIRGQPKFIVTKGARLKMTRELAEARSVGDSRATKFDGVSFLKSLKK